MNKTHNLYDSFCEVFATLETFLGAITLFEMQGFTFIEYDLLDENCLKLYFVKV